MNLEPQTKQDKPQVRSAAEAPDAAYPIPQGQDPVARPLKGIEQRPLDTSEAISIPAGHYALKASVLHRQ